MLSAKNEPKDNVKYGIEQGGPSYSLTIDKPGGNRSLITQIKALYLNLFVN